MNPEVRFPGDIKADAPVLPPGLGSCLALIAQRKKKGPDQQM